MNISKHPMPYELAEHFPVLVVREDDLSDSVARSGHAIGECLQGYGMEVVSVRSIEDGQAAFSANPAFCCLALSWGLCAKNLAGVAELINQVEQRTRGLPILLMMSKANRSEVPLEIAEHIDGFIWLPEDSPEFIAGRIHAASKRYIDSILPPFFGALVNFDDTHEYSWHTPGHTGGTAFMKTPIGQTFLRFYGEQMLRSDLSVSVGATGSLNDHSGPCGESEAYAAKVFGADLTFFSIGGSSSSNQMILRSSVTDGDVVMVDRNCHKSLNHALNVSGAIPVYLMPRRNARGLIGPVPKSELEPASIKEKLVESALVTDKSSKPVLAVLTNSTYDGLCYDVTTTTRELSKSVPRIHYDEAWYAYARFNPLYEDRYGMHRGERHDDDATVTVTHSTHKLLAALSQASMIHIRSGKVPVNPALFNESFMMYTSTSPQYSIIASIDVSARMMDHSGEYLTNECLEEAIAFRQTMVRLGEDIRKRSAKDWWFDIWQPDKIGSKSFSEIDPELLRTRPDMWELKPNAAWHGFGDLGDGYCMLDPIKVSVLTPGLSASGKLEKRGIPAPLVSLFLDSRGIVVEKTEPYSFLVLFSVGITKGKWGSLVAGLMDFKRAYDLNEDLGEVLPELVSEHPEAYGNMGLKDLADAMHVAMDDTKLLKLMDAAFTILPEAVLHPRDTFAELVRGNVEAIPVSEMADRIAAVQMVPYPPGIPLLMPGERVSGKKRAIIDYLLGLQEFDSRFPGFEHHTHGVEPETGDDGKPVYMTYVLKEQS